MPIFSKGKKRQGWSRLDNAAKIFPSTSKKTDTSVFRFYCELNEEVSCKVLQSAVESAVKEFPNFLCAMRKGAFWYYLEETETKPVVTHESKPVCSQIYDGDNSALLFEVTYYKSRINLEIYHALSDGTGALQFLKTIVYYYLKSVHGNEMDKEIVFMENDASFTQKSDDGFMKYYKKEKNKKREKKKKVYRLKLKKNEEGKLRVIEAVASVKEILAAAHAFGTTLTVYLTAIFFEAIHKEMSLQDSNKPIVLMVPVNLRQFFPSETTKNFFGLMDVEYDFGTRSGDFQDIISVVNSEFKEKLTKEKLAVRMNKLAGIERNVFAKIAPLPLKDVALRAARSIEAKNQTAVISNVGRVTMPDEMKPYINMFGVLSGTLSIQLCMCSFGDMLQIGFTSTFLSTDLQKAFIRALTKQGISVTVRSNDFHEKGGDR